MTSALTKRQRRVLETIEKSMADGNRPPSIHELMAKLDIASPNGIAKHLAALEAKGYIIRDHGARGIRLMKTANAASAKTLQTGHSAIRMVSDRNYQESGAAAYIPIVGNIAAGSPILAEENIEDVLPVPEAMAGAGGETFFLRIKGESMIDEGIMPGDLVMVTKCDSVANGELAAVMVEDEATVKRFYRRGSMIVLEPANPAYEPIVIDPAREQVAIVGKITGLLRSYKGKL
ncbi:MAG: transcriptional repressor LexA [Armatimonadetes bacterium]|nr:transcriptional repressor LexA [Armatimonadota bacterium]